MGLGQEAESDLSKFRLLGFLPDADSFAHYAETRFGTLCHHYSEDFCAHYAGIMPKFSKTPRVARRPIGVSRRLATNSSFCIF